MQGSTTWALTMGRRERGAVAVEMAIILPLLLLVVGGIVDFGRAAFTQNVVTNAAREGARMRALGYTTGEATTRMNQAMVGSNVAFTPNYWLVQASGVPQANTPCPTSPLVTDRQRVRVTVTNFSWIFPIPVSTPTLTSEAEMRCGG
jgi:Flp pilus assembly protein TadG